MDRNERKGLKPIASDIHYPAVALPAWPAASPLDPSPLPNAAAAPLPLPRRDPICPVACTRRDALLLLAAMALVTLPDVAAPADLSENDARLQRLEARLAA